MVLHVGILISTLQIVSSLDKSVHLI